MDKELLLWVISGCFVVLWYLLRQKDSQQQHSIDMLFQKHDADAAELQSLKLQIASQHYVKGELDAKFDRLETSFREEMRAMGAKFDKMADAIIEGREK